LPAAALDNEVHMAAEAEAPGEYCTTPANLYNVDSHILLLLVLVRQTATAIRRYLVLLLPTVAVTVQPATAARAAVAGTQVLAVSKESQIKPAWTALLDMETMAAPIHTREHILAVVVAAPAVQGPTVVPAVAEDRLV
jgi:hypothetical protein